MAVPKMKSSTVCQMENDIKILKDENRQFKVELEEMRSLHNQLIHEAPSEKYDEMRVNLLKSQLIQLERQILMQSDALSSRADVLLVVENVLQSTVESMRQLLASDVYGPTVPVERSQLTKLIENLEGARLRLYKNVENNSSTERLAKPVLFMGQFLKPGQGKEVTILDICSGSTDHINLKHVAKLESKLFTLQKNLHALHQSLKLFWSNDFKQPSYTNEQLGLHVVQRLSGQLAKSEKLLQQCCSDLLSLSILVPAAPWPLLNKPVVTELTADMVFSALPSFPRSKQHEGKKMVCALLKACSYTKQVIRLEAKACAEELNYHQAIYGLQMNYVQSLFTAVREAYVGFERNIQELIYEPLKDVLDSFILLRDSASEDALRDFLATFKRNADKLSDAAYFLTPNDDKTSKSLEALSGFSNQFFVLLNTHSKKCTAERDRLANEIEEVKQQRDQFKDEAHDIFCPKLEIDKSGNEENEKAIEKTKMHDTVSEEPDVVTPKKTPLKVGSARKISNERRRIGSGNVGLDNKVTIKKEETKIDNKNDSRKGRNRCDESMASPEQHNSFKMVRQNSAGAMQSKIARPTSSLQRKKPPTK